MPANHRRSLGQYFTPLTVVDFALRALQWLSLSPAPGPATRTLIDPACGDGVFLLRALALGLAAPAHTVGIDRDADLADQWSQRGLGGPTGPSLAVADGLTTTCAGDRPVVAGSFDWVVGNPPYGGAGLKDASPEALARIAAQYELARRRSGQAVSSPEQIRRLPLEVLFVERFHGLCREGGWLAIILPVGIFANERWRYVREWLLERVTLHAVIGLPRATFRAGATTAKTCLAIAQKSPAPAGHEVVFAEVAHIGLHGDADELEEVLRLWQAGARVSSDGAPWESRHSAGN